MPVSEPKRVKIEGKRGLHVVYKGEIIEGLGWDKNTKAYYAIGYTPRKWFHREFSKSCFEFNKWIEKDHKNILFKERDQRKIRVSKEVGLSEDRFRRDDIRVEIPEEEIWKKARDLILTNQIEASRKLGIPEIAYLDNISPPPKALTLKEISEMY